jgi:hypothetical protein
MDAFQPDDPEIADDMPVTESDPFGEVDNYILFEKKQTRSGDEFLDTLYVVEQHIYVQRVPLSRVDVDPEFPEHDVLLSKETLWYKGEDPLATQKFDEDNLVSQSAGETSDLFADEYAEIDVHDDFRTESFQKTNFWGVDAHGILREGKQLSDNWYAIIEKQVVGAVGLLSTIDTHQSYSWPAVLLRINTYSWTRRKGGADTVGVPILKHSAWSGPTRMTIKRYWQKEPWVLQGTVAEGESPVIDTFLQKAEGMFPTPIVIATPIFSVKVSSCLHGGFTFSATTGTNHPIYKYGGSVTSYGATSPTDWGDHIISDTQAPFRGGYLREYTYAYSPA